MTYALYDHWGRFLHGEFETKTEAFLWLLNHLPWKVLPEKGGREIGRVATEFEAEALVERSKDVKLKMVRCDVHEYNAFLQPAKSRYANGIH